ncbi:MAG TPA: response regulator [Chthonomonadaceae bacterium]|nr:response regulator [Chthonomonadaceae bacterium]
MMDANDSGNDPPYPSILSGRRVLVCEDEGITTIHLCILLRKAGLTVVGCTRDGLKSVELALEERPELILMDINMPDLDGLDAAEQILAAYRPCIVIVTAYTEPIYQARARQIGCSGYIVKPFTGPALLSKAAVYFQQHLDACPVDTEEA